MYVIGGWFWWVIVQLVMLVATIAGWFLLIPFCLAQAWRGGADVSISDGRRVIDAWRWAPLNWIYGNTEDGVSGKQAIIWTPTGQDLYMPNAWAPWRAYCWSAWRNSCDNLKYVFAWKNGPRATLGGWKLGWWPENGFNVPVL